MSLPQTEISFENGDNSTRQRTTGIILIIISLLALLDILVDLNQGVEFFHVVVEAFIIPLAGVGLYFVWQGLARLRTENLSLRTDLAHVSKAAAEWKAEASRHVTGLSAAIDSQFTRWGLSQAEKEIALLLLKGMSHKEIAQIRQTAERTARQQALAIYSKSGMRGRAELAAFFLEDLLAPIR